MSHYFQLLYSKSIDMIFNIYNISTSYIGGLPQDQVDNPTYLVSNDNISPIYGVDDNLNIVDKNVKTYIKKYIKKKIKNEVDKDSIRLDNNTKDTKDTKDKILELENKIIKLEQENELLENELHDKKYKRILKKNGVIDSVISDKKIKEFVDEILSNPNINISGVPDKLEKIMYKKISKVVLISLEKIFENIQLELIGHNINLSILPKE